jgi:glutathione synthase/RimK-type ligase-like ATP-grasp enzyme
MKMTRFVSVTNDEDKLELIVNTDDVMYACLDKINHTTVTLLFRNFFAPRTVTFESEEAARNFMETIKQNWVVA